ncbi:MAG: FAD-dependent oxidoreductase [Thermoprotei archaeon]|nr:MAG: FAD-dependent oxidoreductase [Thermoprotei archaeon]RLF25898.1 MAG: FAD-dependent oxidoreductase [Thermoprotei archaeon]
MAEHESQYDVVIIGAGPAGLLSALELVQHSDLRILIVEKGLDLPERECPAEKGLKCLRCSICSVLSGWGGAGAFSDGKLTLSLDVGGWLSDFMEREPLRQLIEYVDSVYVKHGAPDRVYGVDVDAIEEAQRRASMAGLRLIPMKIRHLGTDNCRKVLSSIRNYLRDKVDTLFRCEARRLIVKGNTVVGVECSGGRLFSARYIIAAPGRAGAEWFRKEMLRLGVRVWNNPIDIGVRVEVPASIMEPLTDILYDPKLIYYSRRFDDKVRTFCVNPYGEVITEVYEDVILVNGRSYSEKHSDNTNFAILVSTSFTEPFKEPIAYGKYIARLANMLGGSVIIQRLGDLKRGRRSTPERIKRSVITPTLKEATPGDLSFILPYRFLANVIEMLRALDRLTPGVYSDHTLIYGVEAKFYSARIDVTSELEVRGVKNLYAIGDGAGITRGLMQASISGVIAARSILRKEGIEVEEA